MSEENPQAEIKNIPIKEEENLTSSSHNNKTKEVSQTNKNVNTAPITQESKQIKDAPKMAIVRIRGKIHLKKPIVDTFTMLRLPSKNSCVVLVATPTNLGMIKKVKDFITWGEISAEVQALLEKRGAPYRLHPPRGGYAKKGTKVAFNVGGSLGYRKDKIND